jgi:hypothetical protein
MKKIILIIVILFGISNQIKSQDKVTYAEIYKTQTGWTAVVSGNILTNNSKQINSDVIPKTSERLYILPEAGKLFDTHIYAINYLAKLGFKVVEVYQLNGNTSFLMECKNTINITVTSDWKNKKKIIINK